MECYVETLSDNELLTIFEYLDAKNLKNATLVCRRWNDIIGHSVPTMKKFKLIVNGFKDYENVMKVNRMVYTLVVQFGLGNWHVPVIDDENLLIVERKVQMLSDICCRHGSKIRSFYIYNARFDRPEDLAGILNSMPLLEKFNAMKVDVNFTTDEKGCIAALAAVERLKKLQVSMTGFDFRYLIGSSPKILSLINLQRDKVQFLNAFVASLEDVQTLKLVYNVAINMFLESTTEFKFKLNELQIEMSRNGDSETVDENRIINLFSTQATSLKQLSLRAVSGEVLKASVQYFPLLEKLNLYASMYEINGSFPVEKRFYDSLQRLTNLKEMIIHNVWSDETAAKGVLSICPALVNLEVTGESGNMELVGILAKSNPNVEHVKLPCLMVMVNDVSEIQLKHLKSFHLLTGQSRDVNNLIIFLKNNPTIERLVIERFNMPKESVSIVTDTLVNMPNLKKIELASSLDIVKKVYDGFSNSENKRSTCAILGIELIGLGGFVHQMGPKTVTFQFPEEAGQWDAKLGKFIANYKQKVNEQRLKFNRIRAPTPLEN